MKKITKTILAFSAAALSFIFAACYQDIYGMINEEVPLENCGISGNVTGFTRAGNYIWLSNGKVYFKKNTPSSEYYAETNDYNRQWVKADIPSLNSSNYIVSSKAQFISSDDSNLYIMLYLWEENTSGVNSIVETKLYTTPVSTTTNAAEIKAEDWTEIDISSITNSKTGLKNIFHNQAVVEANRAAFARIYDSTANADKIYKLNGSSAPVEVTENGASSNSISAVYFPKDGKTYFSPYYSMAANDTYIYYSKSYTENNNVKSGSVIFYADGWNGSDFTTGGNTVSYVEADAGGILSIGVTSNYLLLGTTSGLAHLELNAASVPSAKKSSFRTTNNAGSIISEYIFKIFILDPSKQEDSDEISKGTDEYCVSQIYGSISSSSDSFDETGLYSYYPGRGSWNRDGTADETTNGN